MLKYLFFVGIDVSKELIDVSYWFSGQPIHLGHFKNFKHGFKTMLKATKRGTDTSIDEWFICFENTGSYSKALLYF